VAFKNEMIMNPVKSKAICFTKAFIRGHCNSGRIQQKTKDRCQKIYVNRTIQLWNQLRLDALGPRSCKPSNFRKNVRKGIPTRNAASKLTDCILKSLNQKMHVGGIFCDLAKVFDCVSHEILLTKLHHGIKGSMANWFESYLTDIKQRMDQWQIGSSLT
jgi:hypothetical protein